MAGKTSPLSPSFHADQCVMVAEIEEFIRINNENPKPFVLTKKVDAILEKVSHCKAVIGTLH